MSTINRKYFSNSPKGRVVLSGSLQRRNQMLRLDRVRNPLQLCLNSYMDVNVGKSLRTLFMKSSTTRMSPNRVLRVGKYLKELTIPLPNSFNQSNVKIGCRSTNLSPSDRDAQKSQMERELSQSLHSPGMSSWVPPWIGIRAHYFYQTKVSSGLKSQENLEPVFGEDIIDRLAHKIRYHIHRILPYTKDLGVGPHVSPYRSIREMTFYGRASGQPNGGVIFSSVGGQSSKRIGVKVIPCSYSAVASPYSSSASAHTCTGYAPAIVSYLAMSDIRSGSPVDSLVTSSTDTCPVHLDGGYYVDISKRWKNNSIKGTWEDEDMFRFGPCRRSFEPLVTAKDTLIVHQSFEQVGSAAILGLTAPSVRFLLETLATSGIFLPTLDVPLIIAACDNWYSYGYVQQLQVMRCMLIVAHTRISYDGACLPGSDDFRSKVNAFLLDTAPFFTKKMWQTMPKLLNFYGRRGCLLEVLEVINIGLLWAGDTIPTDFINGDNGGVLEGASPSTSTKVSSSCENKAKVTTNSGKPTYENDILPLQPSQTSAGVFLDFEKDFENSSSIVNVSNQLQREACYINYFPNVVSSTCAATAAFTYFSHTCGIGLYSNMSSGVNSHATWWSTVKDVANLLAADAGAASGMSDSERLSFDQSKRRDDRPLLKGCVMLVRCVGEVYSVAMSTPGLPLERLTAVTAWAGDVYGVVCLIMRGALGFSRCKYDSDANFDPVGSVISPRNGGDLIADIFSELGLVLECLALVIRRISMKQDKDNSFRSINSVQLPYSSTKGTDNSLVTTAKKIPLSTSPSLFLSSSSLFRNKKTSTSTVSDIPLQNDAMMDATMNIIIPPISIIAATGINSLYFDQPLVQASTSANCRDAAVQCMSLNEVIFKQSKGVRSFFSMESSRTSGDKKAALLKQRCEEVIQNLSSDEGDTSLNFYKKEEEKKEPQVLNKGELGPNTVVS